MSNTESNDLWGRVIGIPFVAAFLLVYGDDLAEQYSFLHKAAEAFRTLIYVFVFWHTIRFIFLTMRKKFPAFKDTVKRVVWQVCAVFFASIVLSLLIRLLSSLDHSEVDNQSFFMHFFDIEQKGLSISVFVMISYECVYFFERWKHSMYESERLKKEQIVSQFELLKQQVSPHFLFNSLNTVITLVPENPDLAVEFLQRLSNVYRHVLQNKEQNTISLDQELSFLKDYTFLNKVRFGENLIIEYFLPVNIDHIQVVPFTLQMLIENAIKHNIIAKKNPLTISVTMDDHFIVVKNNLQKKSMGVQSTQTGLQNIISRYQLLTEATVEVIVSATHFSVFVPLITKISTDESYYN